MANEYLIPFGLDLGPVVNDIRAITVETGKMSDAVQQSAAESKKAFTDVSNAQNLLLKSTVDANKSAKDYAKELGTLTLLAKQYSGELDDVSVSQEQLNQMTQTTIDLAKKQLSGLKEGSKEYNKLSREIKAAEVGLASLSGKVGDNEKKFERLKKQLADNKAALQQMAAQGLQNTKVFKELEKTTGELDDTIKDVNEAIALAGSDTKNLDNLIGSMSTVTGLFSAAQGTAALFGVEQENIEKALLRVNAAMSILNGLQAVQSELKRKDSLASKAAAGAQALYTTVVGTSTGALKAFKLALASTGIGLLVIALGYLITNFDTVKQKVLNLFPGLKILSEFVGGLVEKFTDWIGITSEAGRQLEKMEARIGRVNETIGHQIQLLEAQGGKEKEIHDAKIQQIDNELSFLRKKLEVEKALSDEELAKFRQLKIDRQVLDIEYQNFVRDQAKKAAEDAEKERKEREAKIKAEKERLLALEKEFAEKLLAFDRQYRDLKIAAIEDESERLRQAENARFLDELANVRKQLEEFKGNAEQKKRLQQAANQVIEQITVDHYTRLVAIEKAAYEARQKLLKNAADLADDVLLSELDKQKKDISKKYDEIIAELEKKIGESDKVEMDLVNALAKVKLAKTVELNAAITADNEKRAAATKKSLEDEGKEFQNVFQKIEGHVTSFLEGAGLSESEAKMVVDTAKQVFNSIVTAYSESIDRQIEAKQRQVDALTDQISEVEEALEREQELAAKGYANNVEAKKAEIDALKAERAKQLEDEKRLQKEKAKIDSISIAQQTIVQTTNLITAATEVFKANSGIPIVGVALAIAAAAALFAGFAAIKARMKAAQESVPKFKKGGPLDVLDGAPSHEEGGVSVYSRGKKVAELEGNEYIINKRSSGKHEDLLRAINSDDFSKLSRDNISVRKLLSEISGVHVIEDAPYHVLDKQRKAESIRIANSSQRDYGDDIKAVGDKIDSFMNQENNRIRHHEDDDFYYETKPNYVRKTRKKKVNGQ